MRSVAHASGSEMAHAVVGFVSPASHIGATFILAPKAGQLDSPGQALRRPGLGPPHGFQGPTGRHFARGKNVPALWALKNDAVGRGTQGGAKRWPWAVEWSPVGARKAGRKDNRRSRFRL